MLIEHDGRRPQVATDAWVAPTAVLCGDVRVGSGSCVAFGAVLVAEGQPIVIGRQSIIREHALLRATAEHPLEVGSYVLVGPRAALYGCRIEDEVFLATGATVFHGARVERGAEVRTNGVVHVRSRVPSGGLVPIGWIAVGDPAEILPPGEHDRIWAVQRTLNFPRAAYGLEREPDGSVDMRELTAGVAAGLRRHSEDRVVGPARSDDPRAS
jgi:carbonic anhydrase/acetyltransferase-like protein (isoleucine patch superfamily)